MRDHKKDKRYLEILGIEKTKALYAESGEEPVYPGALMREWQDEQIDECLKKNEKLSDIVEKTDASLSKVKRRKRLYLGLKNKNPDKKE
jgi:hypothetical protein